MKEELSSEFIVDIIEATVRVLVSTGLTRDQALQVMLSQLAVQVKPETMEMALKVSEKYAAAFDCADWDPQNTQKIEKCGSADLPFGWL